MDTFTPDTNYDFYAANNPAGSDTSTPAPVMPATPNLDQQQAVDSNTGKIPFSGAGQSMNFKDFATAQTLKQTDANHQDWWGRATTDLGNSVWGGLFSAVKKTPSAIASMASNMNSATQSGANQLANSFTSDDPTASPWDTIKNLGASVKTGVAQNWTNLANSVAGVANTYQNTKNAFNLVVQQAQDLNGQNAQGVEAAQNKIMSDKYMQYLQDNALANQEQNEWKSNPQLNQQFGQAYASFADPLNYVGGLTEGTSALYSGLKETANALATGSELASQVAGKANALFSLPRAGFQAAVSKFNSPALKDILSIPGVSQAAPYLIEGAGSLAGVPHGPAIVAGLAGADAATAMGVQISDTANNVLHTLGSNQGQTRFLQALATNPGLPDWVNSAAAVTHQAGGTFLMDRLLNAVGNGVQVGALNGAISAAGGGEFGSAAAQGASQGAFMGLGMGLGPQGRPLSQNSVQDSSLRAYLNQINDKQQLENFQSLPKQGQATIAALKEAGIPVNIQLLDNTTYNKLAPAGNPGLFSETKQTINGVPAEAKTIYMNADKPIQYSPLLHEVGHSIVMDQMDTQPGLLKSIMSPYTAAEGETPATVIPWSASDPLGEQLNLNQAGDDFVNRYGLPNIRDGNYLAKEIGAEQYAYALSDPKYLPQLFNSPPAVVSNVAKASRSILNSLGLLDENGGGVEPQNYNPIAKTMSGNKTVQNLLSNYVTMTSLYPKKLDELKANAQEGGSYSTSTPATSTPVASPVASPVSTPSPTSEATPIPTVSTEGGSLDPHNVKPSDVGLISFHPPTPPESQLNAMDTGTYRQAFWQMPLWDQAREFLTNRVSRIDDLSQSRLQRELGTTIGPMGNYMLQNSLQDTEPSITNSNIEMYRGLNPTKQTIPATPQAMAVLWKAAHGNNIYDEPMRGDIAKEPETKEAFIKFATEHGVNFHEAIDQADNLYPNEN